MLLRRDLVLVSVALCIGISIGLSIEHHATAALPHPAVQESALWDWETLAPKPTGVGQYRHVVRAPTATLDELEMHVTTLNPGQTSHAPHKHPNEELVIIAAGKIEAYSNGQTKVLGPGSIIFNAANQMHGVKNVGDVPATYHVINWASPGTLKKRAEGEVKAPAAERAKAAPAAR